MVDAGADLPRLDEHTAAIAAGAEAVWPALLETVDRTFDRAGVAAYARLVGCVDSTASGPRPLTVGATVPGFRVAAAVPGRELVLTGRHRFSSYTLWFRLEPLERDRCRLRAESRAAFPGLRGRAYRRLVVGSGQHVRSVRGLLAAVRRRAEQQPA